MISRARMALKISVASTTSTKMKTSLHWPQWAQKPLRPQKIKNCLQFTYRAIFLESGTSAASMTSNYLLSLIFLSTLAPRWPILVSQCGMDHQKFPTSNQILPSFRIEAVEDRDVNFNQIQGSMLKCPLPMNIQIHFMLHILISKTL